MSNLRETTEPEREMLYQTEIIPGPKIYQYYRYTIVIPEERGEMISSVTACVTLGTSHAFQSVPWKPCERVPEAARGRGHAGAQDQKIAFNKRKFIKGDNSEQVEHGSRGVVTLATSMGFEPTRDKK